MFCCAYDIRTVSVTVLGDVNRTAKTGCGHQRAGGTPESWPGCAAASHGGLVCRGHEQPMACSAHHSDAYQVVRDRASAPCCDERTARRHACPRECACGPDTRPCRGRRASSSRRAATPSCPSCCTTPRWRASLHRSCCSAASLSWAFRTRCGRVPPHGPGCACWPHALLRSAPVCQSYVTSESQRPCRSVLCLQRLLRRRQLSHARQRARHSQ
jgi:hypothetical protein